jgi:predicted metal-dependent hydrolase
MLKKRKIKINQKDFEFTLKLRKGVKYVKLAMYRDGYFVVTAPKWYPLYIIERFLSERSGWIMDKLKYVNPETLKLRKIEFIEKKELARSIIQERIDFFNQHYGFRFGKVSVRNQRTCWGSCSFRHNLSFNFRVADLPEHLRDYVIVHELCHLAKLNHSRGFWELVSQSIPDYKERRRQLRNISKL